MWGRGVDAALVLAQFLVLQDAQHVRGGLGVRVALSPHVIAFEHHPRHRFLQLSYRPCLGMSSFAAAKR